MSTDEKTIQEQVLDSIGAMQEEQKSALEKFGKESSELKTVQENAIKDIEAKFKTLEAASARRQETSAKTSVDKDYQARFKSFNAALKERGKKELSEDEVKSTSEAYTAYIRGGLMNCNEEQKTLLNNIVGGDGGFLVPPEYATSLIDRKFNKYGIFDMIQKRTIGGNQFVQNVDDSPYDKAEYLNSLANPTEEHNGEYKQVILSPNEQIYKFPISRSLIEDAMFNLESDVLAKGQEGSIRQSAVQCVIGDGLNRPKGILNYVDSSVGQAEAYDSIAAIQSTAATIKWEDVITLLPSELTDDYADDAAYALHRKTFYNLLSDVDGSQQFKIMNQINFFSGEGMTMAILGRPVRFDFAMPEVGTGANAVLFGDFSNYMFTERTGFQVIVDNVTSGMNIDYRLRRRNDGKLCQGRAFKALKMQ